MSMLIHDLPVGTWMTWMDRRSPVMVQLLENKWYQFGGIMPPVGTEVVRIAWKGSAYSAEGKRGEVRETLIYDGIRTDTGSGWDREHKFKKKKS